MKEKQEDIILQLNFIGKELKNKRLGERMQEIFPEGLVFTNALYGLSWCELIKYGQINDSLKRRALAEAIFAYKEIDSEKARSTFDRQLTPGYGIFYRGWKNYLLSEILKADTTFIDFETYKRIFTGECEQITEAIHERDSPYLSSYRGQSWPADMVVGMASVGNYDQIFKPRFKPDTDAWLTKVKGRLDPFTQMIPHKVDSRTGTLLEGSRGSSSSLIVGLLTEIDPGFAREQYALYKENFVDTTLGLPSIREYPKGQAGDGDIDSGPVIFGAGFSGTIVSVGTFARMGDFESAKRQYETINAFGFGFRLRKEKKYAFGLMPIADAFIAWGRTAELRSKNLSKPESNSFRLKFHAISLVILSLLWLTFYFRKLTNLKLNS